MPAPRCNIRARSDGRKATNGRSKQTLPDTGMLQHIGIFGKAEGEEIGRGAGSENRERTEEGIPPEL